jgi:hypothetical protein
VCIARGDAPLSGALVVFCFGIIKQLKYTIEGVNKIPVPLGK